MKKEILFIIFLVSLVVVSILGLSVSSTYASNNSGDDPKKVFVCKYVGTPGVDERLQTGQNPISVSINAIPGGASVGAFFADAQGRSFVLAFDTGQPEPSVSECPSSDTPPPPPSVDVCPNLDGDQETIPVGLVKDNEGNCVTPPPPPPPPVDRCPPGEGPFDGKDGNNGNEECCPDEDNNQKCDKEPPVETTPATSEETTTITETTSTTPATPPVVSTPPVVVEEKPALNPPVTKKELEKELEKQAKENKAGKVSAPRAEAANELPYTGFPLLGLFILGASLLSGGGLLLRKW